MQSKKNNMLNPEITVYITNFNYAKFLRKSINSVLGQSFKSFEIIIIDDGSVDNSKKIIQKYKNNKKIRFFFHQNKGLIKSNNFAIKVSKGKYILRLDADDFLEQNALLVLYNEINRSEKIGLVYSDYYNTDEKGKILSHEKNLEYFANDKYSYKPPHGACSLIRKKFLEEVNFYDQRFKKQDGIDLWYKFLDNYKVKKINLPLFYYRQHSNSLSFNKSQLYKTKNKILKKFTHKNKDKKNKIVIVFPVRGPNISSRCVSMLKLGKKPLIYWVIDEALKSKLIDKIIVTSKDLNLITILKKKYKRKVFFHIRKDKTSFENSSYKGAIINSVRKFYPKNTPDIIIISHFNSPFKPHFYYETAINMLELHNSDQIISVIKDDAFMYYRFKKGKLMNLCKNKNFELNMEKDQIYKEKGGIMVYKYNKYLNFPNKIKSINTNYILLDQKSSFEINNLDDLEIAEKVIRKKK